MSNHPHRQHQQHQQFSSSSNMSKDFNKNLFNNSQSCSNVRAHISGQQLPPWVQGVLLYNGPSGDFESRDGRTHWMDGRSIMSSFKIEEKGRYITFTKKHLRSEQQHHHDAQHGASIHMDYNHPQHRNQFGHESSGNYQVTVYQPQSSGYGRVGRHRSEGTTRRSNEMMAVDDLPQDNCNSSFYQFGDLVMATNESAFERIVDPDSLDTGDLIDMSHLFNMKSGRPLKDHNGDYYNLAASFVTGNKYHFIKFKRPSNEMNYRSDNFPSDIQFVSTIPSRFSHHVGYFHSFGMTDNYLIFCEQPMAYDVNRLKANKKTGKPFRECLEWMSGERNHFYIVDKNSGRNIEINYVTDRSYFFFNFVNCYEYGDHLIVDLLTYDGPEIMDSMWMDRLRSGSDFFSTQSNSKIMRFVLPLNYMEEGIDLNFGQWNEATAFRHFDVINIRPKILTREPGMENPKMNPYFNYRRYNFTYVVGWMHGFNSRNFYSNAITKIDVESGMTTAWKTGDDCDHPSEIVFVPNPTGTSEDDGIIISCVSNSRDRQRSYLVFINAQTMREMARANFDEPIPFGSHTHFIQRFY